MGFESVAFLCSAGLAGVSFQARRDAGCRGAAEKVKWYKTLETGNLKLNHGENKNRAAGGVA